MECKIEGITQTIVIEKKDFNSDLINFNEIKMYKYLSNDNNNTFIWFPITNINQKKKEGIYVCPFGFSNYQLYKYNKEYDNNNGWYYQLNPIPSNNKILFISEDGKIAEEITQFQSYSSRHEFFWKDKIYHYSLLGKCGKEWYPLITEYETEKDLFTIEKYNLNALKNGCGNYKNNNNHY